jgi:hypothetical protein
MSWLSNAYKKAMGSKTTGKIIGASYMAPALAVGDLVSKKPFFKGAAQGQRIALGAGTLIAGGMATPTASALPAGTNLFAPSSLAGGGELAGVTAMTAPTTGGATSTGLGSQVVGMLPELISSATSNGNQTKTDRLTQMKAERKQAEQEAYNRLLQMAKGA